MSHRADPSRRRIAALVACTVLAACSSGGVSGPTSTATPDSGAATTSTSAAASSTTTTTVATAAPNTLTLRKLDPFGAYTWVPPLAGDTPYAGPATPQSLADVLLVDAQLPLLDDSELVALLEQNGFVVQAGRLQYFHNLYKSASYEYLPQFVTTDSMYHTWHLVFDKVLRDIEQQRLLPILERMLSAAVPAARAQQELLAGTALAEDAERATAYYEAAAELLGLGLGTTSDRAAQEVALATAAVGVERSPISGVGECLFPEKFDGCVDYSLFLPRGHYTRAVADAVLAAHPTRIDPERAGIRLMGARFTLDAFVLDQLAWPNVGTETHSRVDLSALDVAAALGSELARDTQLADGQGAFEHYESQLAAMTELVDSRRPDDWAGTVYDAWLVALESQLAARNAAYPDFMQTPAWAAKSLQTALASYTELKHDTILYAKQGSAGEGEGPEPPPFTPRHWVEPDPVAFARLASAASLLGDGMASRGLLTDTDITTIDAFVELTSWLAGIATRELAGQVATDEENARLGSIGSELEYLWFASADADAVEGQPVASYEDSDAVVADIYRSSFAYLELGTGFVDTIYVIVPIGDGRFELAVGAVSSYYEFRRPSTELRLTDEEWRALLSQSAAPVERPSWQNVFLVGAPIADEPVPAQ